MAAETHFAIMRCKKLTGMGSVAGALQHAYREQHTPNADPALTPTNEHHGATNTDEAMGKLRAVLPEKRRKDAVLAVEYVMTASPEWWDKATPSQQRAFFDRAEEWLADKYGGKDRIITATIHRDEKTPHLTAFVVPLTQDGRLSAKEFIGNKTKMSQDQTAFAKRVKDLGLVRGIEGSRATHQTVKSFYGALEAQTPKIEISPELLAPRVTKKGLFTNSVEGPDKVAARLTEAVREAYQPTVQAAAAARQDRQRLKEAQRTADYLRTSLQPILNLLEPLSRTVQAKAIETFKEIASKLLEAHNQERRREFAQKLQRERGQGGGLER